MISDGALGSQWPMVICSFVVRMTSHAYLTNPSFQSLRHCIEAKLQLSAILLMVMAMTIPPSDKHLACAQN